MDDNRRSMTGDDTSDRRTMCAQAEEQRRKHDIGIEGSSGDVGQAARASLPQCALDQSVGTEPIDELRRDISRLEGKVDALLAALEVDDDDGD